MQTEINFFQAEKISVQKRTSDKRRFDYLIDEIDNSNPQYLTASDFEYYASELTDTDPSENVWSANDVRRRMLNNYPELDSYDLIDTFIDSESDDIIDFF